MPEMPEVQGLVDFLRGRATGLTITRVTVAAFAALKTYDPPVDALVGAEITLGLAARQVHRPGHDHRDAGFRAAPDLPPREGRVAALVRPAALDDHPPGQDADRAARRAVGRLGVRPHRGGHEEVARRVRRERPAGRARASRASARIRSSPTFTRNTLAGLIDGRRTQIKGVLRDQSILAGVGNAYSDEILHDARMSPYALAASLDTPRTSTGSTPR